MYKIVSREDTIRIPAEYMRKGASLNDHIDRLSMTAFEGRFDEQNRFILLTTNHEPLGRGRIIHGDGAIYQKVRFDAVLFCMEDYEVVEGAVSEVNEFGAFVRIGPMEALLHKSQIMEDMVDANVAWAGLKDDKAVDESVSATQCVLESFLFPQTRPTLDAPRLDSPANNQDSDATSGSKRITSEVNIHGQDSFCMR